MRRRIAAVAAVSIIAACGGSSRNDPNLASATDPSSSLQSSPSVYGSVRDAAGVAIAGASVSDGQRSVTTQSDGSYTLSESAGTYTLTASKTGYGSATQAVTVPKRGGVSVDWTLTATASSQGAYKVFANNDLGMHCVDKSFAVFSILPPYNVVDAQVVALKSSGDPVVLDASQVQVRYSAIADATGSINSTSKGKSDFWQFVSTLYGAALPVGEGLQGLWMPADAPGPAGTTLSWDTTMGLFKAPGIPIFPVDDAGAINRYPLMRFSAYDKSGNALGSTDVVLPVSEETSCQNCHATGQVAASDPKITWSQDASDLEAQARRNVLILHNARTGTTLQAPVLCATCHYSPALDLAGTGPSAQQAQHGTMSKVMHAFHSDKMAGLVDSPVAVNGKVPSPTTQACYQCHPGVSTQCLRGAMTSAVDCQNCHGNMAAVGGVYPLLAGGSIDGTNDGKARRPWLDLPRCQSCHANDAVTKTTVTNGPPLAADGIRFNEAYRPSDPAASPLLATNTRFAEQPGKLYRKSKGHGGLACEGCHGSTHAVWAANANDNVAATQLQGHAGTVAARDAPRRQRVGERPPQRGAGAAHRLPGLPRHRLPRDRPLEDVRHAVAGGPHADRRNHGGLLHLPQRAQPVVGARGA